MVWIKRNLYFLIGSLIAVALMVVFGFRLYTQISDESKAAGEIEAKYAELDRLNSLNPHPGDANINNIQAAKDQQAAVKAYITKIRALYQPISPIPNFTTNKVSNADFAAELRNTVAQLRRTAAEQSVLLPPDYYFTFDSQKKLMIFDSTTLDRLAISLGEIKALSDILFSAKVNSLDSFRREVISTKDDSNPPDYLPQKTTSTSLADLTPYEITFRCFSTELGLVLGNLAASTNGFVVKSINVEPATPGAAVADDGTGANAAAVIAAQAEAAAAQARFGNRPLRPSPGSPTSTAAASSKNSTTFLNEKPFRVTLLVEVVKLKPQR